MIEIDEINRKYLAYMRVLNEKNNILLEWQKEIDNLAEDYKTEEIKEIKEGRSGNIEEEKKARRKLEEMKAFALSKVKMLKDLVGETN